MTDPTNTADDAPEIDALRAEVARLREALAPFANYSGSDQFLTSDGPDSGLCAAVSFRKGDYLRARAALTKEPQP